MKMSEVITGEAVKVIIEGHDENGQTLNRTTFEAFGLTREEANNGVGSVVDGLVATVRSWSAVGN